MTWLISDEARKHRAFREVWVAYLLGGLYLLLGLYTEISDQNYSVRYDAQQKWWFVQQNIRSYGATLTAFLLAVGLPRLVCCEKEYRTDDLVGTAALGHRYTWRAKTAFTDPENEDKLQQSIDHLTKGKTLIVIAHRLSTIMYADKILMLEDGSISAAGTHEQLLSSSQTYLDMWKAHISAMDWSMNKEVEILC